MDLCHWTPLDTTEQQESHCQLPVASLRGTVRYVVSYKICLMDVTTLITQTSYHVFEIKKSEIKVECENVVVPFDVFEMPH